MKWLLQQFFGEGAMAFTLGHTVLGQTDAALDISRAHEMVHVCQFERWGPLMGRPTWAAPWCCGSCAAGRTATTPSRAQAYEQGGEHRRHDWQANQRLRNRFRRPIIQTTVPGTVVRTVVRALL